jgi:hypothetical protein
MRRLNVTWEAMKAYEQLRTLHGFGLYLEGRQAFVARGRKKRWSATD